LAVVGVLAVIARVRSARTMVTIVQSPAMFIAASLGGAVPQTGSALSKSRDVWSAAFVEVSGSDDVCAFADAKG
jgi:hypothetical protein